ncbi:hypothetical protein S40288_05295 [Stachybotrys chartarum IBT 40288]|nr:hypothetical protein S40288_05295 [Stachybotrys chartarum IBT 40288]
MSPSFSSSPRRKPQKLLLPDGGEAIVCMPDDLAKLRGQYAGHQEGGQASVVVVVHGSDEHVGFLKQSRDDIARRCAELRQRHGPAFDEWEYTRHQLQSAETELQRLAAATSALTDNFNKFGYDADLRTYDNDGAHALARADSSFSSAEDAKSLMARRRPGETVKLFKRPVVKQWFHRGLLWRASEDTQIQAIELFFDLLFVGIVHVNGEYLAIHPTGHDLLRFSVTMIMSWRIWSDVTQILSCFTTNMAYSFYEDESHNTYEPLVAFYLTARLKDAVYYAVVSYFLPIIRGVLISHSVVILVSSALWIASIHVPMPDRLGLIWVALAIDVAAHAPSFLLSRYGQNNKDDSGVGAKIYNLFEFFPAINIEHRVERTNAFVSLVFGYSVVAVLFQNYRDIEVNSFLVKSLLGLAQAFIFNWIYFDIDASNIHTHAIRRSGSAAALWQHIHLPFIMAFLVATAGLSLLVLASDVPLADPERLSSNYRDLSLDYIQSGTRFFYCHGLAIALLCMGVISWCHEHRKPPTLRWSKTVRLANRMVICFIMFFLPLAQDLRSTNLIALTLCLVLWVLLVELWGKSSTDDPFIGDKEGTGVQYTAKQCLSKDVRDIGAAMG